MSKVTAPRKIYNTMAMPLERGIQRLLSKYMPAYYTGVGQAGIADACTAIAAAHAIPNTEDAIRLASLCEPLRLHAITLLDEAEQIEKSGEELTREKRIELASVDQQAELLSSAARMVFSSFMFAHMGMYTSSIKGVRNVLDFVLEVTELSKLRELQGGYCPCGCTYPAGDEAFLPIKEHLSAAVEIEKGLQVTDIVEAMLKHHSDEIIPDIKAVSPGNLPDHRMREAYSPTPQDLAGLMSLLRSKGAFPRNPLTAGAPEVAMLDAPPADDSAG